MLKELIDINSNFEVSEMGTSIIAKLRAEYYSLLSEQHASTETDNGFSQNIQESLKIIDEVESEIIELSDSDDNNSRIVELLTPLHGVLLKLQSVNEVPHFVDLGDRIVAPDGEEYPYIKAVASDYSSDESEDVEAVESIQTEKKNSNLF